MQRNKHLRRVIKVNKTLKNTDLIPKKLIKIIDLIIKIKTKNKVFKMAICKRMETLFIKINLIFKLKMESIEI
jgi:hypothetical protein